MNIVRKIKNKIPGIRKDYKQKREFFGFAKAVYCSVAMYLGRFGKTKHKYVFGIVKECIKETLSEFDGKEWSTPETIEDNSQIWVMWWQGENAMPPIVRHCVESISAHRGKHTVVMLNSENYTDYIQIPPPLRKN